MADDKLATIAYCYLIQIIRCSVLLDSYARNYTSSDIFLDIFKHSINYSDSNILFPGVFQSIYRIFRSISAIFYLFSAFSSINLIFSSSKLGSSSFARIDNIQSVIASGVMVKFNKVILVNVSGIQCGLLKLHIKYKRKFGLYSMGDVPI